MTILKEKQTLKGSSKKAKELRKSIIEKLLNDNFKESGTYSRAGLFRFEKNSKGFKVSFGKRFNFSGKNTKYFTLSKYFIDEKSAIDYINQF